MASSAKARKGVAKSEGFAAEAPATARSNCADRLIEPAIKPACAALSALLCGAANIEHNAISARVGEAVPHARKLFILVAPEHPAKFDPTGDPAITLPPLGLPQLLT